MDETRLELYKSLLIKKKLRGLEDLFFFNREVIESEEKRRKLLVSHVHGEWNKWYQNSKARIKMILVPRGTFKSTFFTVGLSLQKLAKDRNERILLANATKENAQNFLFEIKENIMKNDEYKQLYSDWKGRHLPMYNKELKRWNEEKIDITGRRSDKDAAISTVGAGGNLVSTHYSTIIADDLMNRENSGSRIQTDKVIDWWKRAFSLLDPDGEMLIIGTRWSYYDLYSYIIKDVKKEMKNVDVDIFIRSAHYPDGSLYFPELLDEEKLKELRALQGSYIYSSFYENNPVDEESALIKQSQLLYWTEDKENREDKHLPRKLSIFTVCDPAVSQESHADYSSIVTVGIDHEDNWYILEVRRDKWSVQELIENLFAVHKQWKPVTVSIEVIGQALGLLPAIQNEENERKVYLPLVEIKARPQYKKETRMRAILQPRFERGKIFIKRDMVDLEEELLHFPKSDHDDIIDPLTDIEDIGFPADEEQKTEVAGSNMEVKLQKHLDTIGKKKNYVDPVMGEHF